jgi:AcrR family transcriptional regulator
MCAAAPDRHHEGDEPRLSAADRRRPELLDLAAELIRNGGTADAVTMESLAARAGISKPLVYRCFANREELLLALLDREHDQLDQRIAAATEGAHSFEDQVRRLLDAYLDSIEPDEPSLVDLLGHTVALPRFHARRDQRNLEVLASITALVFANVDIDEPTALMAAVMVTKSLEGLIELWRGTGVSREALAEVFVAFCLAGLHALEPSAPTSRPRAG